MAGIVWMDTIPAVIIGLERKCVGNERSPGIDDVAWGIMRSDPVSERPQIDAISGSLISMLNHDSICLELIDEIRILSLPLNCGVTESQIIPASHQNRGGRVMGEDFGQDANRVGGCIERA